MQLAQIKKQLNPEFYNILAEEGIKELRPCQEKALKKGLLDNQSLLVCTPTASGKTLVGEMASLNNIANREGKALYIVPLKALANEKFKDFKRKYEKLAKITMSIGDLDATDPYLEKYDLIICTAEKLDSLIRHKIHWLKDVKTVIVDEIHLMNDPGRGPTLEILITILRHLLKDVQLIGLSATIGNPEELSKWMGAKLVEDTWRPVELKKGILFDGKVEFEK